MSNPYQALGDDPSVPLTNPASDQRPLNLHIPPPLISFLGSAGHTDHSRAPSRITKRPIPISFSSSHQNDVIRLRLNPDSVRFISYLFFWIMCFFAILTTRYLAAPALANPTEHQKGCPPFERNGGEGFNIATESHLQEAFGFNNICVNWDYSPSRELTAVVYPLFEYTLLAYIILDFVLIAISYKKGLVSSRCWWLARNFLLLQITLCALFRMIFVILAYVSVRGHTAGFLGLQLMLITVTSLNLLYILETRVEYKMLGGLELTRTMLYVYFILNMFIGAVKLYLTAFVVFAWGGPDEVYPNWALQPIIGDMKVGELVDRIWMVFNAIFPLVISLYRSRTEPDIFFTIDLEDMSAALRRSANISSA